MGGCHNHAPFLGTLNIRCRIIIGIQKRTIILTAIHIGLYNIRDCWWSLTRCTGVMRVPNHTYEPLSKLLVSPFISPYRSPLYNPIYNPLQGV